MSLSVPKISCCSVSVAIVAPSRLLQLLSSLGLCSSYARLLQSATLSAATTHSAPSLLHLLLRVPGVKPYCQNGLEHYQTLEEIFNTTTVSGHLRFSFSQVPLSSDEDRELEENFLGHGVHVDIEDDDLMEPLSETRKKKRPRQLIATSIEHGKKNKSEFDSYFKMASSVMNARMEMVKCKSAESTSQCVEKLSIKECIEDVEKLGDIGRH